MLVGGERVSGIDLVAGAVGLPQACARADLVITGEGAFDWQSLHGKVVSGVLEAARDVIVLAGRVDTDAVVAYALLDFAPDRAFTDPAGALADMARDVAMSQYSERPNQR
jgi:glycerate kinase